MLDQVVEQQLKALSRNGVRSDVEAFQIVRRYQRLDGVDAVILNRVVCEVQAFQVIHRLLAELIREHV